jgi:hypothetical protein
MISLLFLASTVHASTYNRLQIPLKDTTSDVVVPLTVSLRISRTITSCYLRNVLARRKPTLHLPRLPLKLHPRSPPTHHRLLVHIRPRYRDHQHPA